MRNDSIFSTEQMILASSSKKGTITVEPLHFDSSSLQTGRIKNTLSKAETQLRSATSLITNEENKNSFNSRRRMLSNTPAEGKQRSSMNLKKIMSSYSSKREKKGTNNFSHWANSLKALPKQSNRYSRMKNKEMLAQAYRAIPRQIIQSKKNVRSRKTNWSRKRSKIPLGNKHTKEDQTL